MESVVIRAFSEMNPWMDMLIFVYQKDVDRVKTLIDEAMDRFCGDLGYDATYSDCIEEILWSEDIEFSVLVGDQDYDSNDTTIDSQELFDRIIAGFGTNKTYTIQI